MLLKILYMSNKCNLNVLLKIMKNSLIVISCSISKSSKKSCHFSLNQVIVKKKLKKIDSHEACYQIYGVTKQNTKQFKNFY